MQMQTPHSFVNANFGRLQCRSVPEFPVSLAMHLYVVLDLCQEEGWELFWFWHAWVVNEDYILSTYEKYIYTWCQQDFFKIETDIQKRWKEKCYYLVFIDADSDNLRSQKFSNIIYIEIHTKYHVV